MKEIRKSSLSPERQKLVSMMSDMRFGRIRSLAIQNGQPTFGPQTTVLREVRFDLQDAPPVKPAGPDFELRRPVVALFEAFDQIGTGRVDLLEIRHGLPARIRIEA